MTTKAEERKALEQIKEIVAKLGENSYIAMAFDGCFERAEQNIENDWGLNPQAEIDSLNKKLDRCAVKIADMKGELETAKRKAEQVQEDCNYWREHCKETQLAYTKEKISKEVAQDKIKEKDQKIIELKAMLFDYMIKEVE